MKKSNIFNVIRRGTLEQYKLSITKVNIDVCNEYGQNLLQESISSNKDMISIDLLERNIDINHQDGKGQTPLHFCAQYLNTHIAELLLRNNANINIIDNFGNNPLWTAVFCAHGDYQIVKLFMKYGADAHHKNKAGRSPLDFAYQIDDFDMLDILENHK